MKATFDRIANTITIVLPLQPPTPSKSGKTMVIASTHGNKTIVIDGQAVTIGVNAYTR